MKNVCSNSTVQKVSLGVLIVGSLWPLLVCHRDFSALFFFEDEWDQLNQLDHEGVWRWAVSVFGENFMPLGKLCWYGSIRAAGGSYFASVVGVWLTHALNVFLLGLFLRRSGLSFGGAMLAMVLFGYSATTFETFAWAIQWSNVLALTFCLASLLVFQRFEEENYGERIGGYALLTLFSLASALCFVRGIFSGLAIAGLLVLPWSPVRDWRRRLALLVCVAAPAILVLAFTHKESGASANSIAKFGPEKLMEMGRFALHCYARSPVAAWFVRGVPESAELALLVAVKTSVLLGGLLLAPKRLRASLLMLVLFELANDAALGVGRAHTGLGAAASSRYQYTSLFVFCPFVGVLFARALDCLPRPAAVRFAVASLIIILSGYGVTRRWPGIIGEWKGWRGEELRTALAMPPESAPANFARLPWMPNERVRELVQKYQLH